MLKIGNGAIRKVSPQPVKKSEIAPLSWLLPALPTKPCFFLGRREKFLLFKLSTNGFFFCFSSCTMCLWSSLRCVHSAPLHPRFPAHKHPVTAPAGDSAAVELCMDGMSIQLPLLFCPPHSLWRVWRISYAECKVERNEISANIKTLVWLHEYLRACVWIWWLSGHQSKRENKPWLHCITGCNNYRWETALHSSFSESNKESPVWKEINRLDLQPSHSGTLMFKVKCLLALMRLMQKGVGYLHTNF